MISLTRRTLQSLLLVASMFCVASLASCGPSTSSVAGTYELDKVAVKAAMQAEIDKQKESGEEDPMAGFGAAMAMGMIDSMSITMTLNADGTATMLMQMMGDTESAKGTWTLDGNKITVTAAAEGETPEPATGTVSGDIITLKMPESGDQPFDMVFKKKA